MIVKYEVDGRQVVATCRTSRHPRIYEVRGGDDSLPPLLGYVQRSSLGRYQAYAGSATPDMVGAQQLGTHVSIRYAVECVVRATPPNAISPQTP